MANTPIKLSVCSPIHNEETNVEELVQRVHQAITPRFQTNWEQILVDDGSQDSSLEIMERLTNEYSTLKLIKHEKNQGERAAWSTAFNEAKGEVVVLLAGDLQSQPEDIPNLVSLVIDEGFDVGTGLRANRKDGFYYWAATRILNSYMCLVFGLKVRDVSSSFFAVKNHFVKQLNMVQNDHRYILAIFGRRGATMKEIPITHRPRIAGRSHYSKLKVLCAIPEMLRFTYRYFKGFYDYS